MSKSDGINIRVTPLRGGVPDDGTEMDAVVRIDVPELVDPSSEGSGSEADTPLNIAFVIDASGSMNGHPIQEARRCVEQAVRSLQGHDRVSAVAYSNEAMDIVRARPARAAAGINARIGLIRADGMTNLHGGWLRGAELAAPGVPESAISRVILLSDGRQNRGICDRDEIAQQAKEMAKAGVTTSTYGLGRQNFNEDLMTAIADNGNGNAYYGETADDLLPRFDAEMGILQRAKGRNVRLQLTSAPGANARVINTYPQATDGHVLPDLVGGAQTWAVVRFNRPAASDNEAVPIFSARITWTDRDTGETHATEARLDLPTMSRLEWEASRPDPDVAERVKEIEAANAQLRVKDAADAGEWVDVEHAIQELREMAGDNTYVRETADVLAELAARKERRALAKEARYGAREMNARYADPDEIPGSLGGRRSYTQKRARKGGRA